MQDWYYISFGEKKPFDYSHEKGKYKLHIPYSGNLVTPGKVLIAQLVDESNAEGRKLPVVKGPPKKIEYDSKSVYHDPHKSQFMAKLYGYAGFIRSRLVVIPPIVINQTKSEAKLYIHPDAPSMIPDVDQLFEIINYANLFPSYDRLQLERNLKEAQEKSKNFITIAKGRPMKEAYDEYIISSINLQKNTGKLKEDGSIDYRDRDAVKEVFHGDIIGRYHEAYEGQEGFSVYGQRIAILKASKGPLPGKNLIRSEENKDLMLSDVNGYLSLKNNVLNVVETLIIDGDIDYEIGNIEFSGNIIIKGKVASGFTVTSFGALEVYGVVEGANLFSSGDMSLKSGVTGKSGAKIECMGNFMAKYMQNAKVFSKGDIFVSDFIYHSQVVSNGEIVVIEKNGLVLGGSLTAKRKIEVNTAGNASGVATELICGIDQEKDDKILMKKKDIALLEERQKYIHEQFHQSFPGNFLRNPAAYIKMIPENKREAALKLVNQLKKITDWIKNAAEELERLEKLGPQQDFSPEIIIHKQKFTGVKEKLMKVQSMV